MKNIKQYSKEGIFIKEWESAQKAGKELGLHSNGINSCCLGNLKTSGGYIWKYK